MKNFLPLFVVLLLTACSNPRYINSPSAHTGIFFKEKGDFKFSGAASFNPAGITNSYTINDTNDSKKTSFGFDAQGAVAVTDHFLISLGGFYRQEKDRFRKDDIGPTSSSKTGSEARYNRSMVNLGLGFYTPLGTSKRTFINIIASGGLGKVTSTDDGTPFLTARHRYYDANFVKFSLQPQFNFFLSDVFRMSFDPKLSFMRFNNIKTNYTTAEEVSLGYDVVRAYTLPMFEPSILFEFGPRSADWLKFDLGLNFSTNPLKSSNDSPTPGGIYEQYEIHSRPFLLSAGISVYPFKRSK